MLLKVERSSLKFLKEMCGTEGDGVGISAVATLKIGSSREKKKIKHKKHKKQKEQNWK